MEKYFNLRYFCVFLLMIWSPFQSVVLKIDAAGRIPMTIVFLTLTMEFLKGNLRGVFKNRSIIIWAVWILYMFINKIIKGGFSNLKSDTPFFVFLYMSYPFIIMMLIYVEIISKGLRKIIKVLEFSLIVFLLILIFGVGLDAYSPDSYGGGDRLNRNFAGFAVASFIFFNSLGYALGYNSKLKFFIYLLLPMITVIALASRTSFAAASIILFFVFLSGARINIFSLIARLGLFSIIAFLIYNFGLKDTFLLERLTETTDEFGEDSVLYTGTFLDNFGDRGQFYYFGWFVFLTSPITGIGLLNYLHHSITNHVLHTEYMTQLTEGGIIAVIIFLLFYRTVYKNVKIVFGQKGILKKAGYVLFGGFFAVLFINFSSWTYSVIPIFAIWGVIIGFGSLVLQQKSARKHRKNRIKRRYNRKSILTDQRVIQ